MKYIYLLLLLIFCSSCTEKEYKMSRKAENTIAMLEQLNKEEQISEAEFQKAKDNVTQYDHKGFFGRYWFVPVLLFFILMSFGICFEESQNNLNRAKPLASKKAYIALLLSGLWGGHWFYLGNNNENSFIKLWKWLSLIIIPLAFIVNHTAIMYFFRFPSMLYYHVDTWNWYVPNSLQLYYSCWIVTIFFVVNVIGGLLFIPYVTYVYNARYFRRHYENDLILSGRQVESEEFYLRLTKYVQSLTKNLEDTNTCVKQGYSLVDPDRDNSVWGGVKRFFKDAATGFNASKLEKEMNRLHMLCVCCEDLQNDIEDIEMYDSDLHDFLQNARAAAYRNLYLAKELIGIVKDKISAEQQNLLVDDFIQVDTPMFRSGDTNFKASDIQFNSERFLFSVGADMDETLKGLTMKLDKGMMLSKGDFISVGIEAGISSAIHGISAVIDLYSETKEARRETQENIERALVYIKKAISAIQKYQATLLRQSEVLSALTNCNKAYVHAYEPLRQQVFGAPTFWKYLKGIKKNQSLFKTDEFRKNLQHLIIVSSKYNQINQSKV